jgi:hypothetical protein
MRLAPLFRRILPPHISEEIQAWMVVIGVVGLLIAPFLATSLAVKVINAVSMLTLATAGIAGVDSARNP